MWKDKAKDIILGLLGAIWAVFTPIHTVLYVVFGLVFADLVAGLLKSAKLKIPITSNRLRDTTLKLLSYLIVILAGFGVDKLIDDMQGLYFSRAFALLIAGTEVTSLAENVQAITGIDFSAVIREKLKPALPPPQDPPSQPPPPPTAPPAPPPAPPAPPQA